MDGWIVIPNWDKFQHYSDRTAPWIKLYLELRDKDEWACLSYAERGLLVSIWMAYSASKGVVQVSKLAQKCGHTTRQSHIDSLLAAGFIQIVASKPPTLGASPEKRREEQTGKAALAKQTLKRVPFNTPPTSTPRINGPTYDTERYVRALISNGVITEPFELDDFDLNDLIRLELKEQLRLNAG